MTSTKETNSTSCNNEASACDCAYASPNINISENKDGYVLQAELPGVNKEGLEVTVEDNQLTITGRRAEDTVKGELLYRESRPLNYQRTFVLAPTIDATRIEAKLEQGVLTLRLPKQEKVKPRSISVSE